MKIHLLLSGLLLLIGIGSMAQTGIAASPLKLEFNHQSGTTQSKTVVLMNPTSRILKASVGIADWNRDSSGNLIFFNAGTLSASCAKYIRVLPATEITLGPNEKKDITVVLDLPSEIIDSAKNAIVFFTQTNPEPSRLTQDGVSLGVNLTVRVGIQVFYNPFSATKKSIEIRDFILKNSKDSNYAKIVDLVLRNNGEVETDGKLGLELVNVTTGEKTILPELKFYTLPGAVRVLNIPIPAKMPKGKYVLTALVDYGPDQELKIGEVDLTF